MNLIQADEKLQAEHGVVADYADEFFGYFGWPTVARMEDGTLIVSSSGLRNYHVCPFGRTVICTSADDGRTWTSPRVINDTPLDDRDSGIISLGGRKLLVTWFSVDARGAKPSEYEMGLSPQDAERWRQGLSNMTDEATERYGGSWVRTSDDGGLTWGEPVRVPVSSPHGPIRLANGDLVYLGKTVAPDEIGQVMNTGSIGLVRSGDGGRTWTPLSSVPLPDGLDVEYFHEPHVVELGDGRLLGLIRYDPNHHDYGNRQPGQTDFQMCQTISNDGGKTWSRAEVMDFHGSPPHLLRHSSGVLVTTYGYREKPYGVRAMLSHNDGETWRYDYVLRDDGPHPDLGYPSSVELGDGSILTVYYQQPSGVDDKCALLWSRWSLPA